MRGGRKEVEGLTRGPDDGKRKREGGKGEASKWARLIGEREEIGRGRFGLVREKQKMGWKMKFGPKAK